MSLKKILLIDDDADDRALFSEALAAIDTSVIVHYTEDAEEGLRLLQNKKTFVPDVIFLDINLPLMSGWQCLKELKSDGNLNDINVIMYSTSSNKRDKDIATDLGALGFITKPDSYTTLKNVLQDIITNMDDAHKLNTIFSR